MPKPTNDETKDEFLARCIPMVMEEMSPGEQDQDRAVAKCNGIWENRKKARGAIDWVALIRRS